MVLAGKIAAAAEASRQIAALRLRSASQFRKRPKEGHLRGIDCYSTVELLRVVGTVFYRFKQVHGTYPDLVHPKTYSEKMVWTKFFAEFPVPQAGNKCLTHLFIPESLPDVRAVPIMHRSTAPTLPPNEAIPEGWYFVKANHGSDMFRKVHFPLSDADRRDLEATCARWLSNDFGRKDGEWWYCAFRKEILLEKALMGDEPAATWCFGVFDGTLYRVNVTRKINGQMQVTQFDTSFNVSPHQNAKLDRVPNAEDYGMKHRLGEIAVRIAKPFRIARVDLYVTPDRQIYLGEVTFAPGNGLTILPDEIETTLGNALGSIR